MAQFEQNTAIPKTGEDEMKATLWMATGVEMGTNYKLVEYAPTQAEALAKLTKGAAAVLHIQVYKRKGL